jgi:hypothetical protein
MAHDVFISYAVEDKEAADKVCRALEETGVKCWVAPRDVPYGADYEEAIVDAIASSRLLVLILSPHSNASPHVKREIQNACVEGSGTQIIPFRIGDVPYNKALRYYLGSAQWLDASSPPLEQHLRRLVEHVRTRLGCQDMQAGEASGEVAAVATPTAGGGVKGNGGGRTFQVTGARRTLLSELWIVAGVVVLLAALVVLVRLQSQPAARNISFNQLRELSESGSAQKVSVSGEIITVTQADGSIVQSVVTNVVAQHEIIAAFEKARVPVEFETLHPGIFSRP